MTRIFLFFLLGAFHCQAQQSLIQNGAMDEEGDPLLGWAVKGDLKAERDSEVFHSSPASLRLTWDGGSGGISQKLIPFPADPFTVRGSARVTGTFEVAQVAVQFFDANGKQNGWRIVALLKPSENWVNFQTQIQPVESAAAALLVVVGKGTGQIWVDDLSAENAGGEAANSATSSMQSMKMSAEAVPLPVKVAADDPHIKYTGRFDFSDPKAPRCAWSASAVTLKFQGTAINVEMSGSRTTRWQVLVDGQPTSILINNGDLQLFSLAKDLPKGQHTVTLLKRTEANLGVGKITGFQLSEGAELLPVESAARGIEVIGDSISAGFGNESKSQHEKFSPETENANIAYGALAARALQAEYVCVAWSGKTLWPKNTITELYDRVIPQETKSQWDFSRWRPQVVVINLGTNDVLQGTPDEKEWVAAYQAFIGRIRRNYPEAYILCAISPMLNDQFSKTKDARSAIIRYVDRVVKECRDAGDAKVAKLEFPAQTGEFGFGAGWHPSSGQHEAMAEVLKKAIGEKLGW